MASIKLHARVTNGYVIPKPVSDIITEVYREPSGSILITEGEAIDSIQSEERAGKISQGLVVQEVRENIGSSPSIAF